jgi:predicted GTPase
MTEYIKSFYSQLGSSTEPASSGLKSLAKSDLLQISNHLTGILADKKINLDPPQLVVVGTQSSGKSSLLNRMIEMDILPTGKTMVTRTPLNLQLINSTRNVAEFGDYIDGVWKITRKIDLSMGPYTNMIHEEINVQTLKKAGSGQGINTSAIILKIFAPGVPNLSLVDLPGLTSVAREDQGQPKDIVEQLNAMIGSFVKSSRSIILLVMKARNDLEVDQAFALAKKYDPQGIRTIGVLTQVDLMSNGTDINDYISNIGISQSLQLKYGYFAIKNRGPDEKDQALTARQVTENEMVYFQTHPVYSQIKVPRLGIINLTNNVSQILLDHIKAALPNISNEISLVECEINKSLQEIGEQIPDKECDQTSRINTLVSNFCRNFIDALEVRGVLINYGRQIKDVFADYRKTIGNLKYTGTDELIANALKDCDGNRMPSVPSIEVLEYFFKRKTGDHITNSNTLGPIHMFSEPSIECLKKIRHLLEKLTDELVQKTQILRFPNLSNLIKKEITHNILHEQQAKCAKKINSLIKIEENYIWSEDQQFQTEFQKFYQNIKPGAPDYKALQSLINSYFDTVKKNLMDRVPKEIMYYFVNQIEDTICGTLFDRIIRLSSISKILEESSVMSDRRRKLNDQRAQIIAIKNLLSPYR